MTTRLRMLTGVTAAVVLCSAGCGSDGSSGNGGAGGSGGTGGSGGSPGGDYAGRWRGSFQSTLESGGIIINLAQQGAVVSGDVTGMDVSIEGKLQGQIAAGSLGFTADGTVEQCEGDITGDGSVSGDTLQLSFTLSGRAGTCVGMESKGTATLSRTPSSRLVAADKFQPLGVSADGALFVFSTPNYDDPDPGAPAFVWDSTTRELSDLGVRVEPTMGDADGWVGAHQLSPGAGWVALLAKIAAEPNLRDLHLWDKATRSLKKLGSGVTPAKRFVAFSPEATHLAFVGKVGPDNRGEVMLADLGTGDVTGLESGAASGSIENALRFTPDGKKLLFLAGGQYPEDASVKVYDLASGSSTELAQKTSHWSVRWSPAGDRVAFSANGVLTAWDVATGATKALGPANGAEPCLVFDPTGRRLAFQTDQMAVRVWDFQTSTSVELPGAVSNCPFYGATMSGASDAVLFSPDGARALFAKQSAGSSQMAQWSFDKAAGDEERVIQTKLGVQRAIGYGVGGKILLQTGQNGGDWELVSWSPVTETTTSIASGTGQVEMFLSPLGKQFVHSTLDSMTAWNVEQETGTTMETGMLGIGESWSLRFGADDRRAVYVTNQHVRVWDFDASNKIDLGDAWDTPPLSPDRSRLAMKSCAGNGPDTRCDLIRYDLVAGGQPVAMDSNVGGGEMLLVAAGSVLYDDFDGVCVIASGP